SVEVGRAIGLAARYGDLVGRVRGAVGVLEVLLRVDALRTEPRRRDEPAGRRADVGERHAATLAILRPGLDPAARLAHDDRVVDRLAVVLRRRDRGHARVVVGEYVAPRAHPREVDLFVGKRDGDPGPVGGRDEVVLAVQLLGEIREE